VRHLEFMSHPTKQGAHLYWSLLGTHKTSSAATSSKLICVSGYLSIVWNGCPYVYFLPEWWRTHESADEILNAVRQQHRAIFKQKQVNALQVRRRQREVMADNRGDKTTWMRNDCWNEIPAADLQVVPSSVSKWSDIADRGSIYSSGSASSLVECILCQYAVLEQRRFMLSLQDEARWSSIPQRKLNPWRRQNVLPCALTHPFSIDVFVRLVLSSIKVSDSS
jgi:hypothetical protein